MCKAERVTATRQAALCSPPRPPLSPPVLSLGVSFITCHTESSLVISCLAIIGIPQRRFGSCKILIQKLNFSNNFKAIFKYSKANSIAKQCFISNVSPWETNYQYDHLCIQVNKCLYRTHNDLWVYIWTSWNWIIDQVGRTSDWVSQ